MFFCALLVAEMLPKLFRKESEMLPFDLSQYSRESQVALCKALYQMTDRVKAAEKAGTTKGGETDNRSAYPAAES